VEVWIISGVRSDLFVRRGMIFEDELSLVEFGRGFRVCADVFFW